MNAIVKPSGRNALAAPAPVPTISADLRSWGWRMMNPHPEAGAGGVPPRIREEARAMLPKLEAAAAPASASQWLEWLKPLTFLQAAPKDREGIAAAAALCAFALNDLPAALLTADAQREALRRFTFWPKPAELHSMFAGDAKALWLDRCALQRITSAAVLPPPTPRPERSKAERQHAAAAVATLKAEVAARADSVTPAAPRSVRQLTSSEIEAALEQAIAAGSSNDAMRARLAGLRARREGAGQ